VNLTSDEVEQIVDDLREMGAVLEIQGSGRVAKYRHQMYEWLGQALCSMFGRCRLATLQ
jgi:hypothetical protein